MNRDLDAELYFLRQLIFTLTAIVVAWGLVLGPALLLYLWVTGRIG